MPTLADELSGSTCPATNVAGKPLIEAPAPPVVVSLMRLIVPPVLHSTLTTVPGFALSTLTVLRLRLTPTKGMYLFCGMARLLRLRNGKLIDSDRVVLRHYRHGGTQD